MLITFYEPGTKLFSEVIVLKIQYKIKSKKIKSDSELQMEGTDLKKDEVSKKKK